jgi:RNase H-fold protein (predicted Holliday junction resolvase)
MTKIIGIDMGTRRVGVALSNTERSFAFPLSVIELNKIVQSSKTTQAISAILQSTPQSTSSTSQLSQQSGVMGILANHLVTLAISEHVTMFVLGESKDFSQRENPIMKQVHMLKAELEHKGFKVALEPEFLSSAQAERFQGKHNKIDASAATIILQSYLDRIQSR